MCLTFIVIRERRLEPGRVCVFRFRGQTEFGAPTPPPNRVVYYDIYSYFRLNNTIYAKKYAL